METWTSAFSCCALISFCIGRAFRRSGTFWNRDCRIERHDAGLRSGNVDCFERWGLRLLLVPRRWRLGALRVVFSSTSTTIWITSSLNGNGVSPVRKTSCDIFTGMPQRVVLPLHSIELMMALTVLCYLSPHPLLNEFLLGAAMHLVFDILVNGGHVLRMPVLFYSFAYRAFHGFSAAVLMDPVTVSSEPAHSPGGFLFQMASYDTKTHQRGVGKGNGARPIISIGVFEGWCSGGRAATPGPNN